jgi:hypothetical protein
MSDSLSLSASVQLRIEEVCARFEAAWRAAGPPEAALTRVADAALGLE